ncbi:MAG: universal stress protein [Gammaproteobacteria bacterium]|nr:universal stress protein [Gammaproteobacteria bacterium]
MLIRDMSVYVDNDDAARARIELAMTIAERHGAHLTAVYVRRPIYSPRYIGTYIPADVAEQLERVADGEEREARDLFQSVLARSNIASHWQASADSPARALNTAGRVTDLLVLRALGSDDSKVHRYYSSGEVTLNVGRPVLIAPCTGEWKAPDKHAVIAWNGSRESARAVHDALPMLLVAERVSVVTFGKPAYGDALPSDLTQYLARHELDADCHPVADAGADTGAALLAFAEKAQADLIVAGAYGHSRIRELVLGGVTRYLLEHTSVPVLMSH